jgi:hypothetical protein
MLLGPRLIAKQVKGSGFRGTISYVLSKEGAELIHSNMLGETIDDLSREFGQSRKLRPKLNKCVYHASLALPEGETLSDKKWQEVSDKYMKGMGFSGSQFIAVKHTDTEHQHIHIIASRIRLDGTVVSDSQDYKRSEKLIRGFEKAHGLEQVKNSREVGIGAPTSGELRKALRERNPSTKMKLQKIIGDATLEKQSMTSFIDKLESQGVGVMANISKKTGHISGISFALDGELMKGSDLGKGFTWGGLKRKGINYGYDKESERVIRATREARAARVQQSHTKYERNNGQSSSRIGQAIQEIHQRLGRKSRNQKSSSRKEHFEHELRYQSNRKKCFEQFEQPVRKSEQEHQFFEAKDDHNRNLRGTAKSNYLQKIFSLGRSRIPKYKDWLEQNFDVVLGHRRESGEVGKFQGESSSKHESRRSVEGNEFGQELKALFEIREEKLKKRKIALDKSKNRTPKKEINRGIDFDF